MKGLELAESYYNEFGKKMLEEFPDIKDKLAVGLIGSGSECFGFDDDISTDHDFEAGFMIFLPGEDVVSRRDAFLLERAYYKLPKEYMGFTRGVLSPVGGNRKGVISTAEFFTDKTGSPDGNLTVREWLSLPENYLAEVTNGKIFCDNYGEVSAIRNRLAYYPEDVRLKKLAGNIITAAQSGQYNYHRCCKHGEQTAAQLAVFEFIKSAVAIKFLLEKRYKPFYKWTFRALRTLPDGEELEKSLNFLITAPNDETFYKKKTEVIENISLKLIEEIKKQNLSDSLSGNLEEHAYKVNGKISDGNIRNMNIFAGV
ncbi:MAG: DUF4037 domain-containing protein [Clostridia bacterium]|nr:DUF4037 domain-containing protein [Clostridia bacterium]